MSVRRTATASECEKQRNKARPRLNHKTRLPFSTTTNIRLPRLPEATTPFTPHSPYRAKPSLPLHQLTWYVVRSLLHCISLTYLSSLFNTNYRQKIDKTPENSYNITAL